MYMALRRVLNDLFIHKVSRSTTATFKAGMQESLRAVFKTVDDNPGDGKGLARHVQATAGGVVVRVVAGVRLGHRTIGQTPGPQGAFLTHLRETRKVLGRCIEPNLERH